MNKILQRVLTVAGIAAVPALINNAIFSRAKALGNTLGGEGRFWSWREGDFFYAHDGDARFGRADCSAARPLCRS